MRISGDQTYGGELLLDGNRAVALVQGWRADPSQLKKSSSPRHGLPALHAGHAHHPGPPARRLDRHAAADRGRHLRRAVRQRPPRGRHGPPGHHHPAAAAGLLPERPGHVGAEGTRHQPAPRRPGEADRGASAGGPQERQRQGAPARQRGQLHGHVPRPHAVRREHAPRHHPASRRRPRGHRQHSSHHRRGPRLRLGRPPVRRHQPLGNRRPGDADAQVRVGSRSGRSPTR